MATAIPDTVTASPSAPTGDGRRSPDLPEELCAALRQGQIRRATALRHESSAPRSRPVLRTRVEGLDELLGGGLAAGAMVELVGRRSCGRFAAVLSALAMATSTGEAAALVDRGDHLDPRDAAAAGVDLRRVLWVRPRRLPETLTAAELLVRTGFALVAVDLGLPPLRGRVPPAAWLRLARACTEQDTVLLLTAPYRLSGCAPRTVLESVSSRGRWLGRHPVPTLLDGLGATWRSLRRRGHRTGHTAEARLQLPESTTTLNPTHHEEETHVRAL